MFIYMFARGGRRREGRGGEGGEEREDGVWCAGMKKKQDQTKGKGKMTPYSAVVVVDRHEVLLLVRLPCGCHALPRGCGANEDEGLGP